MITSANKQDHNDSPDIDNDSRGMTRYADLGKEIGELVDQKNAAYGSAFDTVGEFLKLMYPTGILPEQYVDSLAIVRIFDKLKRIASIKNNTTKEQLVDAYSDIAGYGLLGLRRARSCNFGDALAGADVEAETGKEKLQQPKQQQPSTSTNKEKSVDDDGDKVALSLALGELSSDVVIKNLSELTAEERSSDKWLVLSKKRLTKLVNGSFEPNCTQQRVVRRRYESPNERQADEKQQRLVRDRDEAIAKLAVATDKQTKAAGAYPIHSIRKAIEDMTHRPPSSSEVPAETPKESADGSCATNSNSNSDIDAFIAFQKSELIPAGVTDLSGAKLRLHAVLEVLTKHVDGVGANDNGARARLQQVKSYLRGLAFLEAKELEKQNNVYARWSKLVNAKPTKPDLRRAFEPVEVGVPSSKQPEQKSEEPKP
jgi:hypothetical protein